MTLVTTTCAGCGKVRHDFGAAPDLELEGWRLIFGRWACSRPACVRDLQRAFDQKFDASRARRRAS